MVAGSMPNRSTADHLAQLQRMTQGLLDVLAQAEVDGCRQVATMLRKYLLELRQIVAEAEEPINNETLV